MAEKLWPHQCFEAEDAVVRLLQLTPEDANRPGLAETPVRFVRAFEEMTSGYRLDDDGVRSLLKSFNDGAPGEDNDQFVVVRDIPFYSLCEHHLAPFFGFAHIGYIPRKKIVGLSKFPRVVEAYSRRIQVQERLTTQIADAIQTALSPVAVGVVLEARHLCMESRGVRTPGATTLTSALRGTVKQEPDCRAEFFKLIGK